MSQVVVADFSTQADAEVAFAMMRAAGVQCRLRTDDLGGMVPGMSMSNPVSLIVVESDLEDAKAVLGDLALDVPRLAESSEGYKNVVLAMVGIAIFLTALVFVMTR